MYFNNFIAGGTIIAALTLPPSVVNKPSGPTITRILQETNPDDHRPAYALKGQTMAVALEKLMHVALDRMPKIRRARMHGCRGGHACAHARPAGRAPRTRGGRALTRASPRRRRCKPDSATVT